MNSQKTQARCILGSPFLLRRKWHRLVSRLQYTKNLKTQSKGMAMVCKWCFWKTKTSLCETITAIWSVDRIAYLRVGLNLCSNLSNRPGSDKSTFCSPLSWELFGTSSLKSIAYLAQYLSPIHCRQGGSSMIVFVEFHKAVRIVTCRLEGDNILSM